MSLVKYLSRFEKNKFHVDVQVEYTAEFFKISYLNSENFGYEADKNSVAIIHPNYNRWIKNLISGISPWVNAVAAKNATENTLAFDGSIVVHYHRNTSDYAGWGLHVWGDVFEVGTSWFKPLDARGSDRFGVYFFAKMNSNGPIAEEAQAFYIIHNGDKKDQCGNDMELDYKKSHEAYVVSGDCSVYYAEDEARKSKYFH